MRRAALLLVALTSCTALAPATSPLAPAATVPGVIAGAVPGGPQYLPDLTVAEPDPARPRYVRDEWDGKGWADEDGDGCNTRAEVLQAESVVPTTSKPTNCTVVTGDWTDPYTGRHTTSAADLQIDHLVALGDAARSGGWRWDAERKRAYANDLDDAMHLVAVDGRENERKGDSGPDEWMPPNVAFRCTYVAAYVGVKARWGLTVTPAQADAIAHTWADCQGDG